MSEPEKRDSETELNVVIIGGDAAGLKAAARLRRLRQKATITVLERGAFISYAACGLPYFLSGDIDSLDNLLQTPWGEKKTPEYFKKNKDINVLTECEAVAIDRAKHKVRARFLESGEERTFPYDALVLATGATPVRPELPGCDLHGVTCFTRPKEAMELRRGLEKNEVGRVAIVGGGYIGLELCEAFGALWGVEVLLVEQEEHVMSTNLDPEMSSLVEAHLRKQDVDLRLSTRLTRIRENDNDLIVVLDSGDEESVDRVVLTAGVRPNTSLARDAGLTIGTHGGVLVDAHGRTSDPRIFAAGDCAEFPDGESTRLLPLGSIANRLGRIVADSIAGIESSSLPQLWGTGVVKVFDITVACVGQSAEALAGAGTEYEEYWGCFFDRADYYPESGEVKLKVVRERDGRLAGMQAIGSGHVVRWVDAFAQVLDLAEGDPSALLRFEHAYAPPYSTAMDPLHHLGAMIETGDGWQVSPLEWLTGGDGEWTWICMLEPEEMKHVELPPLRGKRLVMTLPELREKVDELPRRDVILVCARGPRSYEGVRFLRGQGIEAKYVAGGVSFFLA